MNLFALMLCGALLVGCYVLLGLQRPPAVTWDDFFDEHRQTRNVSHRTALISNRIWWGGWPEGTRVFTDEACEENGPDLCVTCPSLRLVDVCHWLPHVEIRQGPDGPEFYELPFEPPPPPFQHRNRT